MKAAEDHDLSSSALTRSASASARSTMARESSRKRCCTAPMDRKESTISGRLRARGAVTFQIDQQLFQVNLFAHAQGPRVVPARNLDADEYTDNDDDEVEADGRPILGLHMFGDAPQDHRAILAACAARPIMKAYPDPFTLTP